MIEAEGDFSRVKVEELFRHPAVVIELVLGITPKTLDAVQVVAPFRAASLLPDDDVRAFHREPGVSLPVVNVVEAVWPRGLNHGTLDGAALATLIPISHCSTCYLPIRGCEAPPNRHPQLSWPGTSYPLPLDRPLLACAIAREAHAVVNLAYELHVLMQ